MYSIDNKVRYQVINTESCKISNWIDNQVDLIKYVCGQCCKGSLIGYYGDDSYINCLRFIKSKEGYEEIVSYICDYKGIYGWVGYKKYVEVKHILIKDSFGRIVSLQDIDNVYYNHRNMRYEFIDISVYNNRKPWNKKKKLRERDNGYRSEPIAYSRKWRGGGYGRHIKYKNTLLLSSDPECKEYGIEGYRKRRVLNAWDIEPWEDSNRNWKNRKIKKQWMIHLSKKDKKVQKEIDMLGESVDEQKEAI